MGNSPRKYVYSPAPSEDKIILAAHLGFRDIKRRLKVKKNDTILVLGSFDISVLPILPLSTLIIIDPGGSPSPLLPFDKDNWERVFSPCISKAKCLRILSVHKEEDLFSFLSRAVSKCDFTGDRWDRTLDLLDYFVQEDSYNKNKGHYPSFWWETNDPSILNMVV